MRKRSDFKWHKVSFIETQILLYKCHSVVTKLQVMRSWQGSCRHVRLLMRGFGVHVFSRVAISGGILTHSALSTLALI